MIQKNIYSICYILSFLFHLTILFMLNSVVIKKYRYENIIDINKNYNKIQIVKLDNNISELQEKQIKPVKIKEEKSIIKKKEIILRNIETIYKQFKNTEHIKKLNIGEKVNDLQQSKIQNEFVDKLVGQTNELTKNENADFSKIVLDKSSLQWTKGAAVKFNTSEVTLGKRTWIGSGIGSNQLGNLLKNCLTKKIELSENVSINSSLPSIDTTTNFSKNSLNSNELSEEIYGIEKIDNIPETLETITPIYPELARRLGVETKILLKILIDNKGKVRKVESLNEYSKLGFEESASQAVSQWKFTTPTVKNHPVSVWLILPLEFRLQ